MAKTVFNSLSSSKSVLFSGHLLEHIPEGHPILIINRAVDRLNIDCLLTNHKGGGTSAYHLRMLLEILFMLIRMISASAAR